MDIWQAFGNRRGGVLVVGHGTRNRDGTDQLLSLADQIQRRIPNVPTRACFLELADPTIRQGILQLASVGVRRTLTIPVLLFDAGHNQRDIPVAVLDATISHAMEVVGQSPPLNKHPSVLQLSARRFSEAIAHQASDYRNEPQVSNSDQVPKKKDYPSKLEETSESIGLAMVGRGTSYLPAIDSMLEFTLCRASMHKLAWVSTGFFAAAKPTVDELLDQAAGTDCSTIVVQPHLLFEGELLTELRQKVATKNSTHPDKRWLITDTLGADPALADTFIELAQEILAQNFQRYSNLEP